MRHGYLIDMDGVVYRGRELIAGADRFVSLLRGAEIPFCFLTNNSQRTRRDESAADDGDDEQDQREAETDEEIVLSVH